MSVVKAQCPSCQTSLRLPEGSVGKKVRCPKCKEVFALTPDLVMTEAQAAAPQQPFEDAAATMSPATAKARKNPNPLRFEDDEAAPRRPADPPASRGGFGTFFAWLLILAYLGGLGAVWFNEYTKLPELPPLPEGEIKVKVGKDAK
jgi:predicted Zn finger-like uncharacterized protein